MRFVAAQNFVGENDGFLGYDGMNNFYFYRKENSSQHVFIAWDEDNAFWGPEYPIDFRLQDNVLIRKAMQVPELRDTYYNVLGEAMRLADEPTGPDGLAWLEFEIRRQRDMIADAMREDPSRPYTFDEHESRTSPHDLVRPGTITLCIRANGRIARASFATSSVVASRLAPVALSPNQHPGRVLDVVLDLHEELHRLATVDEAVVVAERDVHHRPDDDLATLDHRSIRDLVQAEDADLRRVEDRRAHERSEHAAVGDGERAALQILERQRAVLRALGEVADRIARFRQRSSGPRRE